MSVAALIVEVSGETKKGLLYNTSRPDRWMGMAKKSGTVFFFMFTDRSVSGAPVLRVSSGADHPRGSIGDLRFSSGKTPSSQAMATETQAGEITPSGCKHHANDWISTLYRSSGGISAGVSYNHSKETADGFSYTQSKETTWWVRHDALLHCTPRSVRTPIVCLPSFSPIRMYMHFHYLTTFV